MRKHNPKNILSKASPQLCKEWDFIKNSPLTPSTVLRGSNKKVWWKCKKEHSWQASINSRSAGCGCPYCYNKAGFDNCLSKKRSDILWLWNYKRNKELTPFNVTYKSGKKAWWKCRKNHEWNAVIGSVVSAYKSIDKVGCPYCSGQSVCRDNCLKTINPLLAKEWDYEKNTGCSPDTVGANSPIKYWWKCCNGHEWKASPNNRNRHGRGCAKCRKYILSDGTACDSLIESFYYLKYKQLNISFVHDKRYPESRFRFDFYFPDKNQYVEVSSFTEKSRHGKEYHERIQLKRKLVAKLNASFIFICRNLTPIELAWIKAQVVGRTLRNKIDKNE